MPPGTRGTPPACSSARALKGVGANLGLNALSAQASELTEEFRPGAARKLSDDEVTARIAALKADYDKIIAGIQAFAAGGNRAPAQRKRRGGRRSKKREAELLEPFRAHADEPARSLGGVIDWDGPPREARYG